MEIYLDNSATTVVCPEAAAVMNKVFTEDYGNPSSAHMKGMEAEAYLRQAKEMLSKILRCKPGEILFTSGGTESDNLSLIGTVHAKKKQGKHLITTQIEHPAILRTMEYLEREEGCSVTYLPVNNEGLVSLDMLKAAITPGTILVSVMHTNNEIGAKQPIEEIGKYLKAEHPEITFHVDAVQGFGKDLIYPRQAGIDLLSVSSHKIHGPKGVGFLYIAEKTKLAPITFGGGQQGGMRSGTENVPGIAGMAAAAARVYGDLTAETDGLYRLKKHFSEELLKIEGVTLNGPALPTDADEDGWKRISAPHIVSASFAGVRSEVLLHALEEKGIYVSAGSACATHKVSLSDTLQAIGLKKELMDSTLRFSFSVYTTEAELEKTLEALKEILPELRKYSRH
ncbi:cysteine desulfurase [Lachnospiraceae bacterium XPB1003]|nr:cysteine desulfurase [Lachnospiraceae bacterium XPB1003]